MISRDQIDSTFVQYGDSCILGSYAIAANLYTGLPKLDFFKDFARHYNPTIKEEDLCHYFGVHFKTPSNIVERIKVYSHLTELNKYEVVYDLLFHEEYQSGRISSGLGVVKELHDKSSQPSFTSSRKAFTLRYIPNVRNNVSNIIDCLERAKSLLIVAFKGDRGGRHISVVGYDSAGFYMIETRPFSVNGAVSIPDILSLPEVGDALISAILRDTTPSNK